MCKFFATAFFQQHTAAAHFLLRLQLVGAGNRPVLPILPVLLCIHSNYSVRAEMVNTWTEFVVSLL